MKIHTAIEIIKDPDLGRIVKIKVNINREIYLCGWGREMEDALEMLIENMFEHFSATI